MDNKRWWKKRRWEGRVGRDKHAIRRGADAWTWMVRVVCGKCGNVGTLKGPGGENLDNGGWMKEISQRGNTNGRKSE